MEIQLIKNPVSLDVVAKAAAATFGDMAKSVVDIERGVLALGGELHADAEAMLIADGSLQKNVWGINLCLDRPVNDWIEFQSLINIRPVEGNRSLEIESAEVRDKITEIVARLITR